MDNRNKTDVAERIARKRQDNNKLFESHRQNVMPQMEAIKSSRHEGVGRSSEYDLSDLIGQTHSLISSELGRNYHNLETIRQHSEQLREDDIVEKYLEAEQTVLSNIERIEKARQELDSLVADVCRQVNQIMTDVGGFDVSGTHDPIRSGDTPVAYGGPGGMAVVDKKKDPNGTKAFEKALAANAAGMGVSSNVIAKAMKHDN